MMARAKHPEWEALMTAAEKPARQDPVLREHLATCGRCADAFARATRMAGALTILHHSVPPAATVERVLARVGAEAAGRCGPGPAELLSDLIGGRHGGLMETAAPVSDSATPDVAEPGRTPAIPRILVYASPRYAISLTVQNSARTGAIDLSGRITPSRLPDVPRGGRAFLVCGAVVREGTISPSGEFAFETSATVDRLILEIGGEAISVGPLPTSIGDGRRSPREDVVSGW